MTTKTKERSKVKTEQASIPVAHEGPIGPLFAGNRVNGLDDAIARMHNMREDEKHLANYFAERVAAQTA